MTEFGKWLLERRKAKNFTQGDLAERLGMHVRSITQWELGRGLPNRNNLRRIAAFFEVDAEQLVSAVFRQSGELPVAPENGSGLDVPVLLGDKLKRVAGAVGMKPMDWLEEILAWADSGGMGIRSLLPSSAHDPHFDKVVGVTHSNRRSPKNEAATSQARRLSG